MDENKIRVKTTVENHFFHDFMQKQTNVQGFTLRF